MSTPSGFPSGKAMRPSNKQRRMGPAPIASFEDLNEDFDPLEDKVVLKPMPEIREEMQPCVVGTPISPGSGAGSHAGSGAGSAAGSSLMGSLMTPSTPRIDISRASSSSHHDSHDSSPERELYGEVLAEGGSTLGLGFKEEGTADLRSSTEELNFHTETGTVQEKEFLRRRQKQLSKLQASGALKNELDTHGDHERKDSTCSDLGLLSISGRTSRLSSIGSAASGGSGVSHISNISRLSVTGSHLSGASGRSTSPHKMLVETSFCGSTPSINQSVDIATPPTSTKHEPRDTLEKILLAKSVDPTMAIVAGEAIRSLSGERKLAGDRSGLVNGKGRLAETDVKAPRQKSPSTKVQSSSEAAVCPEELARRVENERARRLGQTEGIYMRETEGKFISLKFDSLGNSLDVEEKPTSASKGGNKASKTTASESEGTYISLKGEPESLPKETKPTAKKSSGRGSSKGGIYLQETEGKFISLKYSQDYSQDSQDGEDIQPAPRPSHGARKTAGCESEGTFVSLKSDGLDKVTVPPERPRSRSPRLAAVTKACIEVEAVKRTATPVAAERRADKSKLNNGETEGTYISLKADPDVGRVKEVKVEPKRSSDSAQKKVLKVDTSVKIVASLRVDKVSAKPKEEKRGQAVVPKRSSKPIDFKNIPPEGIFISLKPGSSMEEEERVVEKAPPLKDCGKSSRLCDNEGQYMRETEGTFISLKGDLSSSLDREERGVEIPITLNLSEAGKSGKTVQTFSQLVQKDVSRPSKEIAAAKPLSTTPSASPKPARHAVLRKDEIGSRTPSPSSSSRKSSFTSLFRRGEVLSPESPSIGKPRKPGLTTLLKEASEGLIDRTRSRSKSREPHEPSSASVSPLTVGESRDLKLKNAKNKSVFTALFKKKERKKDAKDEDALSPAEISSPEPALPVLDAISNVEFTFAADRQCSAPPLPADTAPREDEALDADNLLPSESVMLPTLSQLYRDHKELFVEKPKPPVDLEAAMPERPMKPALENVEDAGHCSSESERDFEVESIGSRMEEVTKAVNDEEDHERKGIFSQQDSVDEELPYIPTTLPQERSVVVPLVPAKQRALAEVRTCPVERPRSTTPINPSLLDEFVTAGPPLARELKMKISLPREDSVTSKKSPRRSSARSWFEFAEQGLQSPREYRKGSLTSATSPSPPPLPPRAPAAVSPPPQAPPPPKVQNWINFEEIPERRKPPKRIQTIPSRMFSTRLVGVNSLPRTKARTHCNIEFPEPPKAADAKGVQYSYVNPEDCKCECHEPTGRQGGGEKAVANGSKQQCSHSDRDKKRQPPRLEVEDKNSCVSDSSCEYVNPYTSGPAEEFNIESLKVMKPFGMDLDVSSNRSSVVSQDEQPSPDNELPHHVH